MQFINTCKIFYIFITTYISNKFNLLADLRDQPLPEANYSNAAIISMVPPVFRKYLTMKPKNISSNLNSSQILLNDIVHTPNITEIRKQIFKYNDAQTVINEDTFGPLQNDSVIIVIQVS